MKKMSRREVSWLLAHSELALVFAMRSRRVHAWRLRRNRWLLWSAIGSTALVVATVYVPALQGPFATHALGPAEAAVTFLLALVPFVALEAAKGARAVTAVSDRAARAGRATSPGVSRRATRPGDLH